MLIFGLLPTTCGVFQGAFISTTGLSSSSSFIATEQAEQKKSRVADLLLFVALCVTRETGEEGCFHTSIQ